jgi:choline dehydrogenase-like flavoprotein
MKRIETEVLIIGSGFGAAAPALRLAEAGAQVLMIEKGKDIVPERDFKQTQDPKYLLQYLKGISSDEIGFTYAEALGGGSGFYEMVSLRAPSTVFDQTDSQGRRLWPAGLQRDTLDPYYDIAERMLKVEQIAFDEIPKSGVVFSLMMKNLGYSCDRARYAVTGCIGSGYCITGCIFGAKQSLHLNYLPLGKASGMTIATDTEAICIRPLVSFPAKASANRALSAIPFRYTIDCRNLATDEIFTIRAKLVILGGGTVGTAKLLLNSRTHLHFLSDHVGKNIAFNGSVKAAGLLPDGFVEGDMLSGRSHPGFVSYHFFDDRGITISSAKPLPLDVVTRAHLTIAGEAGPNAYWGEKHIELMKLYRRKMIVLYALGLTPPCAEIHQTGEASFGPYLHLTNDLRMYYKSTKELLESILKRNGCRILDAKLINAEGKEYEDIRFTTTHMIGSCRMADRIENGVTDAYGEVFNYPGLYVADGAAIPSSLAVNSSLTILANAERIAAHIVKQYIGTRRSQAPIMAKGKTPTALGPVSEK